jgi:predicted nucleic acid-binding protein
MPRIIHARINAETEDLLRQLEHRLGWNDSRDTTMDFTDACLVDMATAYRTGRILALDRDFRVYRWGRNRPFDPLLPLP